VHWSLVLIINPKSIANIFSNSTSEQSDCEDGSVLYPIIIYFDSFFENNDFCINVIKKYLFYEYGLKKNLIKENELTEFIKENHEKIKVCIPKVIKFIYNYIYRFQNKTMVMIAGYFY
jgi:hypothetical protein